MNPATITTLEALCDALNRLVGVATGYPGDLVSKVIAANGWQDLQDDSCDVCAHGGRKVTMQDNPMQDNLVEWKPLFYITAHDAEEVSAYPAHHTPGARVLVMTQINGGTALIPGTVKGIEPRKNGYLVSVDTDSDYPLEASPEYVIAPSITPQP